MSPTFTIAELEARQEEALARLGELEQQINSALAEFTAINRKLIGKPEPKADQTDAAPTTLPFTPPVRSTPAVKVA